MKTDSKTHTALGVYLTNNYKFKDKKRMFLFYKTITEKC